MKSIIKSLKSNLVKLRALVEKREGSYYNRSDNWQESEVGEEYEYKTSEIEDKAEDLEGLIGELENL